MTITAIVTCTENGGIGFNTNLPWPRLFSAKTNFDQYAGSTPCLMGKTSYECRDYIVGDRPTYVLTSNEEYEVKGGKRVNGTPEEIISQIASETESEDLIVAGGTSVFNLFYDHIDEWIITVVQEPNLIYDTEILLAKIKADWPKTEDLGWGTDHNQRFIIIKLSK